MNTQTVTFRLNKDKRKALDAIAAGIERDRSYVLNEAVNAYLEVYRWQVKHIREGLRQANARKFATDKEVTLAFAKWRNK